MSLNIVHFDENGTQQPYVENPYQRGVFIRKDVFMSQFTITMYGEDICIYNSDRWSTTRTLGQCGLLEQAIALSIRGIQKISEGAYALDGDESTLSFNPQQVYIKHRGYKFNDLVLSGIVKNGEIHWCYPVLADDDEDKLIEVIAYLEAHADVERMSDNDSSAKILDDRVRSLDGHLIPRRWRERSCTALQNHKFIMPNI